MSSSGFAHPPENRYLDDYVPGAVHEFGSIDVDERDVIEFGRRYGRFLITTHSGADGWIPRRQSRLCRIRD
jgi:hypothetical protein